MLVGRGVDQLAREAITPRPVGKVGVMVVADGEDNEARAQLAAIRPDTPATVLARNTLDLVAEAHVELVMLGVILEVLDPRVTRRELSVTPTARAIPRHGRHRARRVEAQAVVAAPPA